MLKQLHIVAIKLPPFLVINNKKVMAKNNHTPLTAQALNYGNIKIIYIKSYKWIHVESVLLDDMLYGRAKTNINYAAICLARKGCTIKFVTFNSGSKKLDQ